MKPSHRDSHRHWRLMAGIILGTMTLQVAFLFLALQEPDALSWTDPNDYHAIAKGLYEGRPYSDATTEQNLYRSPGFPFLLSLIMHVVGTRVLPIRLFLVVLTAPFLLVLYRLGSAVGDRSTGLLTMALGAIYPLYIYTPLTLYPESLLLLLFAATGLLLFYARDNCSPAILWLLGAAISTAIMVRPTSIVWIPVALFHLFRKKRPGMGCLGAAVVALVLIPALCVASWMYRNYRVHGCALFTTAGSMNLLRCYNERATGRKLDTGTEAEFKEKLLHTKGMAEREQMRTNRARSFIVAHPGKALRIAVLQCLDLWNPIPPTRTQEGMARLKYKVVNAFVYVPVLILAVGGFIICRRNQLARSFLLLTVLNTLVNGAVGVSVRYRLVTDFVLILMAACTLITLSRVRIRLSRGRTISGSRDDSRGTLHIPRFAHGSTKTHAGAVRVRFHKHRQ